MNSLFYYTPLVKLIFISAPLKKYGIEIVQLN